MELYGVAIVPLIIGVVELLKSLGLPSKFSALGAAVLGGLIGVFYLYPRDIPKGVIVGLSYGLAASGLYSGTKNTVQGVNEMRISRKRQ
ncbi:MAG TPA: hypothetical protein VFD57_08725 [Clostridia bacterium]|nr:hypothetical protein [Clostridia bacterium]